MCETVIEAEGLEKCFLVGRSVFRRLLIPFGGKRRILAIKGVSFVLKSGRILGVVGPNGAGKTTLLRILADLLEPDSGTVSICGEQIGAAGCGIRKRIGYVSSDERSFFWRLTGRQNLKFFSRLYGMAAKQSSQRAESMLDNFGLKKKADQLFRDYSTGTRKKFSLIRALVHKPAVLLLDEVTNSLDPPSAAKVKAMVRNYVDGASGRGAVWSTHRLEEIREICDTVLSIEQGDVNFFGAVSDFEDRLKHGRGGLVPGTERSESLQDSSKLVVGSNT